MNKKCLAVLLLLFTSVSFAQADDGRPRKMLLDKVVFQISAKQWVNTQSALLTVGINATLTNADLMQVRAEIMNNLGRIAKGEWHLTQFDRAQDSSGLEKLSVLAQARVPQSSLTEVYQSAKKVSKPGATYEVNGIDFKPSDEEIQKVKSQLRENMYQQVNEELTRLNKVYGGQNYTLNRLIFIEGDVVPMQPKAYQAREMNTMVLASAAAPPLTVSNELTMNAMVEVASNRDTGGNALASH